MLKCPSGKKVYLSFALAEDALIDAWTRFEYTEANGPINVYLCDEGNHYHFTSKGKMNERLAKLLKDGSLLRQREANRWGDKFRHKH
jgi:hypothetical protein